MNNDSFQLDRVLTEATAEQKLVKALFQLATPVQLKNVANFDLKRLEPSALVAVVSDITAAQALLAEYKAVSKALRPLLTPNQLDSLRAWCDFLDKQLNSVETDLTIDEEIALDTLLACLLAYL